MEKENHEHPERSAARARQGSERNRSLLCPAGSGRLRKWVLPPEHASKGVLVKPCGESLQGILVLHLQGDVDKVRADDIRAPDYAAGGANSAKGGSVQLRRAGGLDEHDVPERAVLLDGEGAEGDADEVISSPVQAPRVDGVVHVVEIAQVGTALPVQLFSLFPAASSDITTS